MFSSQTLRAMIVMIHSSLHLTLSVFFFKKQTAYELLLSLVGSEMCIGDRCSTVLEALMGAPALLAALQAT